MEVIVPADVKPDPDLEASGRNLPNSRQRVSAALSTSSGGGHSKITSIYSSSGNNSHHHHPHHHSIASSAASLISSSVPVRITTLSGQQLQTMAKSSGLSVVHVTVPQVSKSKTSSISYVDFYTRRSGCFFFFNFVFLGTPFHFKKNIYIIVSFLQFLSQL